jgi:hypothetical protein
VGEDQENDRHIVAETILAGEQEEELADVKASGLFALTMAIFSRFAKDFFVSDGPCHAGGRDRQNEQPRELHANGHYKKQIRCSSEVRVWPKIGTNPKTERPYS